MLVTPLPIVTLVSLLHSSNAQFPMLVTLSGIVTLVRLQQPANTSIAMRFTPLPIITFVNPLQPENAQFSICITEFGITIFLMSFLICFPFRYVTFLISTGLPSLSKRWQIPSSVTISQLFLLYLHPALDKTSILSMLKSNATCNSSRQEQLIKQSYQTYLHMFIEVKAGKNFASFMTIHICLNVKLYMFQRSPRLCCIQRTSQEECQEN